MATEKQIAANRRNAQKSTGPRTTEGKETVSRNAVTHGLTSALPRVLPQEMELYRELQAMLCEEFDPQGVRESLALDRIVLCFLRLHRVGHIEASVLMARCRQVTTPPSYDTSREIPPPEEVLGRAYHLSSGDLKRLSRHERQLERSLNDAIHELERLQYARKTDASSFYVRNLRRFPMPGTARVAPRPDQLAAAPAFDHLQGEETASSPTLPIPEERPCEP